MVLRIHRDDGPDILTFTEAGGLARSGLNSAGIGLTANALQCDRDYNRGPGIPLPSVRRKVLESAYLATPCTPSCRRPGSGPTTWRSLDWGWRGLRLRMCTDDTFWLALIAASTSTPTIGSPSRRAPR